MNETPSSPLAVALELANKIVDQRTTIPILECALLTADGSTLLVETTDLDTEVSVTIPFPQGRKFRVAGPADALRDAAAFIGPDVQVADSDGRVMVADMPSGLTAFTFPTGDVDKWPRIKPFDVETRFEVQGRTLAADVRAVAPAMSNEETRYYLNGILVETRDGELRLCATDGHRLHWVCRPIPEGVDELRNVIIPKKAVRAILAALAIEPDATVEIALGDGRIELKVGPVTIRAKLIDGTFPDYFRVIPKSHNGALLAKASDLIRASEACIAVHGEGGKTRALIMSFKDKTIRGEAAMRAEVVLPMDGVREGNPPDRIGLNCFYFQESILALGREDVRIALGDAASPLILTAEGSVVSVVLMPMRV